MVPSDSGAPPSTALKGEPPSSFLAAGAAASFLAAASEACHVIAAVSELRPRRLQEHSPGAGRLDKRCGRSARHTHPPARRGAPVAPCPWPPPPPPPPAPPSPCPAPGPAAAPPPRAPRGRRRGAPPRPPAPTAPTPPARTNRPPTHGACTHQALVPRELSSRGVRRGRRSGLLTEASLTGATAVATAPGPAATLRGASAGACGVWGARWPEACVEALSVCGLPPEGGVPEHTHVLAGRDAQDGVGQAAARHLRAGHVQGRGGSGPGSPSASSPRHHTA